MRQICLTGSLVYWVIIGQLISCIVDIAYSGVVYYPQRLRTRFLMDSLSFYLSNHWSKFGINYVLMPTNVYLDTIIKLRRNRHK